jgi:hypothetical protein
VKPVPFSLWLAELQAIETPTDQDINDKPALKLLPFFRGLASGEAMAAEISVERAKCASATTAGLTAISGDLMGNWIAQWEF